jgi:3-methyladenine DNA glycosylase AlkD
VSLATEIDRALRAAGSAERAAQEKRYLKSDLTHYGAGMPAVRAAAKAALRAHPDLDHAGLIRVVEELWSKPVHDRRAAAVELLVAREKRLTAKDLPLLERLLRESRTWALVDMIAPAVVGPIVERDATAGRTLDRWARDDDFWLRRAAMLALLIPLRRGGGDWPRFTRYAEEMLEEKEFFIRKAIGWILREVSKKRPELVAAWLAPRMSRASGVTLRAARALPSAPSARQPAPPASRRRRGAASS